MVFKPKDPVKGDLAYCKANYLGVILLVDEDNTVNNVPTKVYRGIHLSKDKLGQPWQSTDPRVAGNIHELVEEFENKIVPA